MPSRRYRPVVTLLLVLHVAACAGWQPSTKGPREIIEDERPSTLRITRTDGTTLVVDAPSMSGDSITAVNVYSGRCTTITTATGRTECVGGSARVGVAALDDVTGVEVWRGDGARIFGFFVVLGVVAYAGTYALLCLPEDSFC